MSRFSRINPFLRGMLILAAIAGLVVVFQLEQTLTALYILARVAFVLAIAYFIFLTWREQREGISMWSPRAQWVFYGAAVVAVADVGVYWYGGGLGVPKNPLLARPPPFRPAGGGPPRGEANRGFLPQGLFFFCARR